MKRILLILIFLIPGYLIHAQPIKIMLVTGGHSFDTEEFFEMFDELKGIEYIHFEQPKANEELVKNLAKDFDVLVFYDMWKTILVEEKDAYMKLTKEGKPFLFLHHSIASYQKWPEFENILGGKYFENDKKVPEELLSTYEHDVWVYSKVVKYTPVTKGFKDLRFFDEIYGNVRVSDNVIPLLKTRHPKSMEIIAWENRYNASKIIYLQPGHDKRTYVEADYRKLVTQAINYLATSK
ncbi:MAG: ThuA domain-containing protein [Bacteroidetes bacterium]|nr:ThuA domain-containing protein [Bacteroidota bacterium]